MWYSTIGTLWNCNITYYNHSLYSRQQCPLIHNLYTLHCFMSSTALRLLVKSLYKYICTKQVQNSLFKKCWNEKTDPSKKRKVDLNTFVSLKVWLSLNTQNQLNMHTTTGRLLVEWDQQVTTEVPREKPVPVLVSLPHPTLTWDQTQASHVRRWWLPKLWLHLD